MKFIKKGVKNTCCKLKKEGVSLCKIFKKSIMNTKVTLTIEKEVIEIAKEYAKEKGQSLSEMV